MSADVIGHDHTDIWVNLCWQTGLLVLAYTSTHTAIQGLLILTHRSVHAAIQDYSIPGLVGASEGALDGALVSAFVSPSMVGALEGALEGALVGAFLGATNCSLTHRNRSFGARKCFISVAGLTTPTKLVPSAAT